MNSPVKKKKKKKAQLHDLMKEAAAAAAACSCVRQRGGEGAQSELTIINDHRQPGTILR